MEGWEDESDKTNVTLGQLFQIPAGILSLYKKWFVQSFQFVCKAKETLAIDHTKKNIFRQNIFFFFDKEHAQKMWISLLTRNAVKIDILLTGTGTLARLSVSIASRPFG